MRIDDDEEEKKRRRFNYFACHIYMTKNHPPGGPSKYGHACKEGNNKQHHFDALACVFVCPLAKLPFFFNSKFTHPHRSKFLVIMIH
jgi:hypothetical protein